MVPDSAHGSDNSTEEPTATDEAPEREPTPTRRRIPVRRVLMTVGTLCFAAGWVLPHGHHSVSVVVELPVATAESAASAGLPPGWAPTSSELREIVAATDGVELVADGTEGSVVGIAFMADGCGRDTECAAEAGQRVSDAVAARLQQRTDSIRSRLEDRKGLAEARVEPARAQAGELASLTVAEFTARIGDGSIHPDDVSTATSQQLLAGYQSLAAANSEIDQIDASLAQLDDPVALVGQTVDQPTVSTMSRRADRVLPVALSFFGGLVALVALVAAPVMFPDRRRFLRRGKPAAVGRAVLLLLVAGVAVAALSLARLASSAATTRSSLERLRNDISEARWDALGDDLRDVAELSQTIRSVLDQPVVRAITAVLPGGLAQRSDIAGATGIVEANALTGADIVSRFESAMTDTSTYSERLSAAREALATSSSSLSRIAEPISSVGLVDEIRVRHDELVDRIVASATDVTPLIDDLRASVTDAGHYLLLVGSTSEPRGAAGGYYMVGTVGFDEKGPDVGSLRGITSGSPLTDELISFVPPGAAQVPPAFASTYAGFGAGSDWTSLALSPRFDAIGPIASSMWAAAGGDPVRGVIAIDPVALEHLLRLTGPITIVGEDGQDRQIDAGNVVIYLDDGQYRGAFGDPAQRVARQGMLRDTVTTVVEQLRDTAPDPLWFNEMSDAIRDRHLMMWFEDPAAQASNADTQIAGSFDGRSVSLTVSPMSGKYAPMLDVAIDATVVCGDGTTTYDLVVSTTFAPDVALHNYIAGSTLIGPGDGQTMYGLVQLVVPRLAEVSASDGSSPAISGDDGPSFAHAEWIDISLGESDEHRVSFRVPTGTELVVEPTGGSGPVVWSLDGETWDASEARHELSGDRCS